MDNETAEVEARLDAMRELQAKRDSDAEQRTRDEVARVKSELARALGGGPASAAPSQSSPALLPSGAVLTADVAAGIAAGNINLAGMRHGAGGATLAPSEGATLAQMARDATSREFESRRQLRSVAVPTKDSEVRSRLRELGLPVTLFGDREMERRDRLRVALVALDATDGGVLAAPAAADVLTVAPIKELFFTEGPDALAACRRSLATVTLARAADRLARERARAGAGDDAAAAEAVAMERRAARVALHGSEVADDRPLSCCAYTADGAAIATASWGGTVKLWGAGACDLRLVIRAHGDRVTGVAWRPTTLGVDIIPPPSMPSAPMPTAVPGACQDGTGGAALLTGCADGTARLWSTSGTLLRTLVGHGDRLGRVAWHPLGAHVATASFDRTWRLWDVETGGELLCQEGHSRAVYAVAFQSDGALAASSGLDALIRVWDLRTGRTAQVLTGHVKPVLSLDWSPTGYHLATAGEDHTARVWDLRKRGLLYTIPAHGAIITAVKYEPTTGHVLMTASHDGAVKLWASRDYRLLRSLPGGAGAKVMAADAAPGLDAIAAVGYDRTLKVYRPGTAVLDEDDEGGVGGENGDDSGEEGDAAMDGREEDGTPPAGDAMAD